MAQTAHGRPREIGALGALGHSAGGPFAGRRCRRRASARARALLVQGAARRSGRVLRADRAGKPRPAGGPRGPAQGGGPQGQARQLRRSRGLPAGRPGRRAAGRLDPRRRCASGSRLVERDGDDPPQARRHHREPARRRRLVAQPRLLRSADVGARQGAPPRHHRRPGARNPAALPRRARAPQGRPRDVHHAGAGRRRRRPRPGRSRFRRSISTACPTARAGRSRSCAAIPSWCARRCSTAPTRRRSTASRTRPRWCAAPSSSSTPTAPPIRSAAFDIPISSRSSRLWSKPPKEAARPAARRRRHGPTR